MKNEVRAWCRCRASIKGRQASTTRTHPIHGRAILKINDDEDYDDGDDQEWFWFQCIMRPVLTPVPFISLLLDLNNFKCSILVASLFMVKRIVLFWWTCTLYIVDCTSKMQAHARKRREKNTLKIGAETALSRLATYLCINQKTATTTLYSLLSFAAAVAVYFP